MTPPALPAYELDGRTAIVTGAGSGIGRATALLLAHCGARVVCADIDADGASRTAGAIEAAGGAASARVVDIARADEVDALFASAAADRGRLDIVANVAGIGELRTPVVDVADDVLERILAVNLKGTFYCCRAAARVMCPQGTGAIVNVASSVVDTPAITGLACYGMSKAAIVQLTRTLAHEVAASGVRVNAVSPGFILTPHSSRHFTDATGRVDEERRERFLQEFRSSSPLGLVGEPDDVAHAILYLVSDAARFMTGQILRPNGGQAMP